MGESRGGRGGSEAVEPTRMLRQLVDEYSNQGIQVGEISCQRITENVYAVKVIEHGQHEPETFFIRPTDV